MNKFCSKCGSVIDSNSGVCVSCKKEKNKKALIIALICIIAVLVVSIIGSVIYFVYLVSDDKNKTATETFGESVVVETQAEKETQPVETQAPTEKFVRDDTVYNASQMQKYNGEIYYCSSDQTNTQLSSHVVIDFSDTDLGYKKIPVDIEGGEISFVIYEDKIYFIAEYEQDANTNFGVYISGKLYCCDLDGKNRIMIARDVSNPSFKIIHGKVYFNIHDISDSSYKQKYACFDIDTNNMELSNSDENIGGFASYAILTGRYPEKTEFEGGYYYCKYDFDKDPEKIDGNYVNKIYYREDIETGEVERVGIAYSQTG